MPDGIEIVEALAKALDRDDFDAAGRFLAENCAYESPKGLVTGREAIIDAYRASSDWGRATFDEVVYESEIEPVGALDTNCFSVTYTDRIRKGELWHTHQCRQIVEVEDMSGKIIAIVHQNLDGEAERFNAFLSTFGLVKPQT
ncbi:MAG TPA: DUF4440 domain-containing protein [Methylocystis sp.]|nr:DUF4440 domain-containing protein [Methylocystis sp.]